MSGLTLDILNTFCGVFIVQCVKLMLIIFEFGVLLFYCYCFVYRHNVAYLKRFARHGHYAYEVEDNHRQTRSCILNHLPKIRTYAVLKSSWLRFFVDTL